jgi:hypothetical protein
MFGTLALTEQGKTALVINAGQGRAQLMTLPVANAQTDQITVVQGMSVDGEGNVSGQAQVSQSGAFDLITRQIFGSLPPGVEPQVAAQVLTLTGQNGSGNFHLGQARDLSRPYAYSTEFKLPALVQLPGPGALKVPAGLGSISGIAATFDAFAPEQRSLPMAYPGRRVSETITLTLPDGLTLSALPPPTLVQTAFGRYQASVQLQGRELRVQRELVLSVPGQVLRAEDYPVLRKMAQDVQRDLRRQLVY